jgi:RNA recognition motif-containing protein
MKIFQTTVLGLVAAAASLTTTSAFSMSPSGRSAFSLMMSDEPAAVDDPFVSSEEPEKHTVYVGNLPFSTTQDQIQDLFAEKDISVLNIAMPMSGDTMEEQRSKGFCFVDVESEAMITSAVDAFNEMYFDGRNMRVNKLLPKEEVQQRNNRRDKNFTPDGQKKMYVGNLSFDATYDDIKEHFEQYGEVSDLYIPMRDDRPRGFCFITMPTESADSAMAKLNGADFMGRSLVVNEPLKKGESLPPRQNRAQQFKLYVGNLSFYTTQETLQGVFEEFGDVYDCYLPTNPDTDQPRGFGFISMSQADGELAIAELDGLELDGRFIRVNEAQGKRRGPPPPQQYDNDDVGDW